MSDAPEAKNAALIPTGNSALITRSAALVKRGLETLASLRVRVVHFPRDRSMGSLGLYDPVKKDVSQNLGDARGDVTVPPGVKLSLDVSNKAIFDLSPLTLLRPDDVQRLTLFEDEVFDKDLEHIKHLRFLEVLLLSGQFTDAGLEHLGKLTGLRVLVLTPALRKSHITDPGLVHLKNLTELEELSLLGDYGAISNAGLAHISKLQKLRHLNLNSALINGVGLSYLRQLPFLNSVNLSNAEIFDADISKHIRALTKLERLGLRGTHITDEGLNCLRNLTKLQYLDLEGTHITDKGLTFLRNLPKLQYLNLASCKITDSGLAYLQDLKTLKLLGVPDTNVSDAAINSLREALPNCHIWTGETREPVADKE